MAHSDLHPVYVDGCFACKIKTLRFNEVPGGNRELKNYDTQAVDYVFGSASDQEEVLDQTDGVGVLKRDKTGRPYKRRRLDGTYEQASLADMDRVLFGRPEKDSRTLSTKRGRNAGGSSEGSGRRQVDGTPVAPGPGVPG